jgi:acid phosphatase type 7
VASRGGIVAGLMLAALYSHAPAAADPVLVAAGDVACDPADEDFNAGRGSSRPWPGRCRHRSTARLIGRLRPDRLLMLGDAQYADGRYEKFLASYGAPWGWGRWLPVTRPVPGNHDYGLHRRRYDPAATGYYTYFDSALRPYAPTATDPAKGYYSFDLRVRNRRTGRPARWHLVALNSMCAGLLAEVIGWKGGCSRDSTQVRWLRRDLRSNGAACTLAYWHHPLFSSGSPKLRSRAVRPLWRVLYRHRADVVLNGNAHRYERFRPQTPSGGRSRTGLRQFIVGSGGHSLAHAPRRPARNSAAIAARTFGVLRLVLHGPSRAHPHGWYRWRFHRSVRTRAPGDAGSADCVRARRR